MTKELDEVFRKLHRDVTGTPWDRLVQLHKDMYRALYGIQYDGKTFFSTTAELLRAYPGIVGFIDTMMRARKDGLTDDDVQEIPRIMVQYNYLQAGCKDFYVYEDLVPMLRDTDLPEVPADELHFPFEAFSVVFKQGTLRGRGVYIDRMFVSCPDGRNLTGFLASDDHDAAPVFMAPLIPPATLRSLVVESKTYDEHADPDVFTSARDASTLLFNLLLYINCENADVRRDTEREDALREKLAKFSPAGKKTRRQKVLEQEYREAKRRSIYLVGKNVKADGVYGVKAVTEEGRKILKRFRVRGHFRNQPCGPERSRIKRRWIAPHWRGPDLAEMINSGYVVKR